ncbi:phage tail protein [Pseudomonas chlororaphis]|uniref:phage tail protein n=1 Tax=Pseudomonas chlororaphis TaxID=587753 RepID=UPI0003D2E062|nr:phage tail protein [Pseudomonas chlororaphis]AZD27958.1 Prophage long tail fiber protein [Pseudomonas chlororaphis]ETD36053.1 tail protein [Pseudomonas chlororaphis subsp. aurantiaca PB-St2]QFS53542.1 phage tail protein [Pseudomonas chlororaphis subsp. aurantiaca]
MADYYTLLTNAGIAYETACKAAGVPIKLSQISVGDGGGAVYNPAATDTALKREVWRGPLNALFQDEKNPSWLMAEVTIPPEVGGWYVREAGLWTDTGILYAIVKYPESFKPVLATSGSGKEFYIRSIFETSNASLVTLLIDDTVVKATRAWVAGYVADELAKLDSKQSVRVSTTANIVLSGAQAIDGVAVVAGDRVLVKAQSLAKDNGIYVVANGAWTRSKDADASVKVTSGLIVSVEEGALLADTIWQLVTDGAIVLGTTALTFQNITKGFAPLDSPALTSPTGNTAPQFDNSQLLINSAFLKRRGVEFGDYTNYSASAVLTVADIGKVAAFASEGEMVATLPTGTLIPRGGMVKVLCAGGSVTVKTGGTDTIDAVNYLGSIALSLGDTAEFIRIGTLWRLIGGTVALKYAAVMSGPNWNTPPKLDNSKSLATTEFVQRALGSFTSSFALGVGDVTLTAVHVGARIEKSGVGTITLPKASLLPRGASILITTTSGAGTTVSLAVQAGDSLALNNMAVTTPYAMSAGSDILLIVEDSVWRAHASLECLRTSPLFACSSGAVGYQRLPSGAIDQWGTGITDASGYGYITFPVAFPTAMRNLNVLHAGSMGVMTCLVGGSATKTGVTIRLQNVSGNSAPDWTFYWRALGF